ncbi:hypothetical protein AU476_36100 [Cupriavidus sp. UYMSc13B]|nr:hypothetical protein AU476_36100 [Cupriavidus sp. UYMSc13B]
MPAAAATAIDISRIFIGCSQIRVKQRHEKTLARNPATDQALAENCDPQPEKDVQKATTQTCAREDVTVMRRARLH